MTNRQISEKVLAALMLKDFARQTKTSRHMHSALAVEAETAANKLLEV